jgi:hypothetical protein
MSVSLLIAVNVLADIALLGGLAYVMSHARKLEPHVPSVQPVQSTPSEQLARQSEQGQAHAARPAHVARPDFARSRASMASRSGTHTAARESA